ncbi:hypothetical protein [Paenibacillus sp. FSL R5-0345]|nr:hypothetical protein [Paenibacillus sp. FSL R5-0345]
MRSLNLREQTESGNTVLQSIHQMEEHAATVDDVMHIKHGTNVADGTLEK